MSAGPDALRAPLSDWEEAMFGHFTAHTEQENALLGSYEDLAERSPNEFVRYLAAMLLEDERRHHHMFTQLANTVVSEAGLERGADDVPPITRAEDAPELVRLTERLLELEEDDKHQLARLRRELKPLRESTMWDLLVQLAERDTEKHLLILRFIHDVARQAARG